MSIENTHEKIRLPFASCVATVEFIVRSRTFKREKTPQPDQFFIGAGKPETLCIHVYTVL